ncbi:MAG TPA: hypothetical protein VMA83_03585 [Solirubrobacteraceae bacterium]|nr:hypothetical protein [Solirubrobacteraceae bacterium]
MAWILVVNAVLGFALLAAVIMSVLGTWRFTPERTERTGSARERVVGSVRDRHLPVADRRDTAAA